MKRPATVPLTLAALLLSAPALAQEAAAPATPDDDAATAELRQIVEQSFAEMSAGNLESSRTTSEHAVSWDFDPDGNPSDYRGAEAWNASLDAISEMMAASGMQMQTTVSNIDCHAVAGLGYCMVDWSTVVVVGGEPVSPPMLMRSTIVARKQGDAWVPEHWHASFAAWPMEMMGGEGQEMGSGGGATP